MEANGIVLSPDPRLRQECAVIEEITPAIEALAEKMKKMMFDNGGCGLAAPQIGELIQLVTIDCDYSENILVVKTLPGGANTVAAALDYCKWPEIIGTVAGDDSILVVIKPKETAPVVRKRILDMLQD